MFVRPLRPADCALSEKQEEGGVVRGRWYAPDDVTRIDVLEGDLRAGPFEVVRDRVAQKHADVAVLDVARRVPSLALRHQMLTSAFRDDDQRVAPALESLPQR